MVREQPIPSPGRPGDDDAGASTWSRDAGRVVHASPSSSTLAEPTETASLGDRLAGPRPEPVRGPLPYRDGARYEFIAEHGRGGLGRVYRARDRELARDVALKELLHPTAGSAETRFLREILVTAQLEHPGIVPIHEAGRWLNGTPYYAMKLVAGRPLSELLKNATTLDERLALLPHLIAVADAVAYAHDRKVIHRDLKPANVLVGDYGETVVIDWGLAKELADADEEDGEPGPYRRAATADVTVVGTVLGTPSYMSPEQARGERVDTRTDVYALGAILFQLCTGAAPPSEATADELRGQLRGLPQDLAAIARKALEAAPDDRYPNAFAFAADLRAYDTGARITARRYTLIAMLGHWLRHHKGLALSVAIPLVAVAVLGVLALREIVVQRDLATDARRTAEEERGKAERERDKAVRSEIRGELDRDPTEAARLLASRPALTLEQALLTARVRGRATAEDVLSFLPFRIWGALPDENFETIAISTSDSNLRRIDLVTGIADVVAEQQLTPPVVARRPGGLVFGRYGFAGPELVQTGIAWEPITLGGLRHSTDQRIVSASDGTYLLGRSADLLFLPRGKREFQLVRRGVVDILPQGTQVLACADKQILPLSGGRIAGSPMDPCLNDRRRYFMATSRNGYVSQVNPSDIVIASHGLRRQVAAPEPNQLAISDHGLVVGIDGGDRRWYIPAGGSEKKYGPNSDAIPTALAADGRLGVWGDMDGVAHVRDAETGASWTLVGHSGPVAWIFVSERLRKVVTAGGSEVRVWRIPDLTVRPVARLSCIAYAMASSPDRRRVAVACGDGTVSLLERGPGAAVAVRLLHKQHNGVVSGLTWRGGDVCSSGRDGRVLCADAATGAVVVVGEHDHPVRFVDSAGDVLAYTVEDGTVWRQVRGEERATRLYHHSAEPYRVAVSPAGHVASGGNDGSVMSFDRRSGNVYQTRTHTAGVHQVLWRGDEIVTSSYDGTVRTWGLALTPRELVPTKAPVRQLEFLGSAWIADVGGTRLWLHRSDGDVSIDIGPAISDLAVSPDGRFAAATASGDVIVYDVPNQAVAAVHLGEEGRVHFVDDETVFVYGAPTREILSLRIAEMSFVKRERKGSGP